MLCLSTNEVIQWIVILTKQRFKKHQVDYAISNDRKHEITFSKC